MECISLALRFVAWVNVEALLYEAWERHGLGWTAFRVARRLIGRCDLKVASQLLSPHIVMHGQWAYEGTGLGW